MKKILLIITLLFSFFSVNNTFAWDPEIPTVNCIWLPGCLDENIDAPSTASYTNMVKWWWVTLSVTTKLITMLIEYTAVIAVISLMISWIMYLISFWEEEKIKKAKSWIIWSLGWVLISISAWWIVNIINNISINY